MRTLLILVIILFSTHCPAQFLDLRTGYNISKRQYLVNGNANAHAYEVISGFNVGALYAHKFNDVLGVRGGLDFHTRGYRYFWDITVITGSGNTLDTTKFRPEFPVKKYYIDLPIHLQFHHEINRNTELSGFFGPYLGYQVAGRSLHGTMIINSSGIHDDYTMEFDDLKKSYESRWDYGLQFGGSVLLHNFMFEAVFALGLKSKFSTSNESKTPYRSMYLSLGYRFEL